MSDDDLPPCLVHTATGSFWVKNKRRKRRASPKAIRFADLKSGDVLIHRAKWKYEKGTPAPEGVKLANDNRETVEGVAIGFAICEDRWFDPVAGQDNRWAGEMASVRRIDNNGRGRSKDGHTLRGFAQQGYHMASPSQASHLLAFADERDELVRAWKAGEVAQAEARMMATPFAKLLRDIDLEEEYKSGISRFR